MRPSENEVRWPWPYPFSILLGEYEEAPYEFISYFVHEFESASAGVVLLVLRMQMGVEGDKGRDDLGGKERAGVRDGRDQRLLLRSGLIKRGNGMRAWVRVDVRCGSRAGGAEEDERASEVWSGAVEVWLRV